MLDDEDVRKIVQVFRAALNAGEATGNVLFADVADRVVGTSSQEEED